MIFSISTFLCLVIFSFQARGFNVDVDSQSIKYLLSETQLQLKQQERPLISGRFRSSDNSESGPVSSKLPSSFFGYNLRLTKLNNNSFT